MGVGVSEKLARRDAAYNAFTVLMGNHKGMDTPF